MQSKFRLIEVHEQLPEESLKERVLNSKGFSPLGPPELLHFTRVRTKTFGKKETKTSFCFLSGLNLQTPAHLSLFLTQLMAYEKDHESGAGKIEKACYCTFDAFRRLDLQVEVKIPGGVRVNGFAGGKVVEMTPGEEAHNYQNAFHSSVVRRIAHRYFPFIKIYDEVLQPSVLQQILPRLLPTLHSKNLRIESKQLTRTNYCIDSLFKQFLQRNLTKTANVGLKHLQQIQSNIGNLMVCALHQQQMQHKKVVQLTAACIQNQFDFEFLFIQAKSLLKLQQLDKALKISKHLILSCHNNSVPCWELLCRCYFASGEYKEMMVALNTSVCVVQQEKHRLQQWTTSREEISSLMYRNNKGFNVSKPVNILECSLQPSFCIDFDNDYVNRFTKIKTIKGALEKQEKEPLVLRLLQRMQTALGVVFAPDLLRLLVMVERLKGWEHLINVRNRVFWLESDFNSVSEVLSRPSSAKLGFQRGSNAKQGLSKEGNNDMTEVPLSQINDISQINQTQLREEVPSQSEQQKQDNDVSLVMSTHSIDDTEVKPSIPAPEAATKRLQFQVPPTKKLNEMFKYKILCSERLEHMINTIYSNLNLLSELDTWEESLSLPVCYSIDRNQLIAVVLLKKSFLETKMLRFRKTESSLKKALKYVRYDASKLSIQSQLCSLYLEGRKFKACELYMVELLATLWNLGLREYDMLPQWLVRIGRSLGNALGGTRDFEDSVKNWPAALKKAVWDGGLQRLYGK